MKTIIALIFIATLAVTKADEKQAKADLIQHVAEYADVLKKLLEENWTVEAKDQEITLTSKFEFFYVASMSRGAGGPPEFSDKIPRELLEKESDPEKYVIRLRFEQSMPREELDRMRIERQKIVDALNSGVTKVEYGLAWDRYREIKIPTYSASDPFFSYDVFQELPDSVFAAIHPPKSVQKIGGAKEILAVVLRKILTAHN